MTQEVATITESVDDQITTVGLQSEIDRLKSGETTAMSTFTGGDRESKISQLKAMTDSRPLSEVLGTEIELANFVIQPIQLPNQETGEMVDVPRIVLVDTKGNAYHAVSAGVFTSLKNIVSVLGLPADGDWPIKVVPKEEKTNNGVNKVFTLKIKG